MQGVIISFLFFLFIFVMIGVASVLQKRNTRADYLLANSSVKPWLVALSAVATNNSGYMFIGMIGYTYVAGISSMWLMIGWILGDLMISSLVHKRLRETASQDEVLTFGGALGHWLGRDYRWLKMVSGLVIIAFVGTYAAAQMQAGSKALHVLFGWDYSVGAIIGITIVLIYCLSGGIRASIWTDAAQSFVMFTAMALLFIFSVNAVGGLSSFADKLDAVAPNYLSLFPHDLPFGPFIGPALFVFSWIMGGIGVIGQPHIMVRFMALKRAKDMNKVRLYYYFWYISFSALTIAVGLSARLLIPEGQSFDPELALPTIALQLMPSVLVGLVLAGLFAATISTADSQVLVTAASITEDLADLNKVPLIKKVGPYMRSKLATVLTSVLVLVLAVMGSDSVFVLTLVAWSALASAFGPLLIVYALGGKPPEGIAIAMLITGVSVVIGWYLIGLNGLIYEAAPGIILGFVPYLAYLAWKALKKPAKGVNAVAQSH